MMYTIEKSTACDDEGLVKAQRYEFYTSECTLDYLIANEFKDEIEAGPDYKLATVTDIEIQDHLSYSKVGGRIRVGKYRIKVTVHLQLTYEYKDVEKPS